MKRKQSFKNTNARPGKNIEEKMPPKHNPRDRSRKCPKPSNPNNKIRCLTLIPADHLSNKAIIIRLQLHQRCDNGFCREVQKGSNNENPRGKATGEGVLLSVWESWVGVYVVVRAWSADKRLDESNESKVEEEA